MFGSRFHQVFYKLLPSQKLAFKILIAAAALFLLDQLLPPNMTRYAQHSAVVRAADGSVLRSYLTPDGMVRLKANLATVGARYQALLIAYEDRRFWQHSGVDARALGRAGLQMLRNRKIVSGGSTLTMQVARLLEPRRRTLFAKAIEMLRAWQLERRYSKREILQIYLTLAPFGGNLEGIEAGSGGLYGKHPAELTVAQAAVLVALPQSPTKLRKSPAALKRARDKVLRVAGHHAGFTHGDIVAAQGEPVRLRDIAQPFRAPHLADRVRGTSQDIRTTIDARLQRSLENKVATWTKSIDPRASMAILIVRLQDRKVQAYIGSAGFRDNGRDGQVDAVRAVRSPGSALKPFIYARAFDEALAHPMTLIDDVETNFGVYAPSNFEDQYHGRVTLADALRLSLNVPAVILLDKIGPVAFTAKMQRDGLNLQLPKGARPGLPIALGGVGVRLDDMAASYAALASDGVIRPLQYVHGPQRKSAAPDIAGARARAWVSDILRSAPLPDGVSETSPAAHRISVKTGTSYGYRDAWALGYDQQHVVAVWTGRPDGSSSPGHFGVNTAAPILFDVFALLGIAQPMHTPNVGRDDMLPPHLTQIGPAADQRAARALRIAYPVNGTLMPFISGQQVALEARGGASPLTWLINGQPLGATATGQSLSWTPDGPGFHDIAVLDAAGRAARVRVRLSDSVSISQGF
jgi:penicillin-binding protein 1C